MTVIDTTRDSLTVVKSFSYRGSPEEWGNTYFFDGDLPSDPSSWKTLADAVIAAEKTLYASAVTAVKAIGHQAGQSVAVWSYDYAAFSESVAGTFDPSTGLTLSGDTANWLRWSTDALTDKGKPIYLRNYYHPAYSATGSSVNDTLGLWKTAAEAFGAEWIAGFTDGDSVVHHRAGPHGVAGIVATGSTFVTTRTLRRRGKRP